jgi:hypothetical protein
LDPEGSAAERLDTESRVRMTGGPSKAWLRVLARAAEGNFYAPGSRRAGLGVAGASCPGRRERNACCTGKEERRFQPASTGERFPGYTEPRQANGMEAPAAHSG